MEALRSKEIGCWGVNMIKRYGKRLLGITLPLFLFGLTGLSMTPSKTSATGPKKQPSTLTDQVRHELVMLPRMGVFDELGFTIEDSNTVVLSGEVTRQILKSDAEAAISHVAGISKVVNNIEVLPLSPFDDSIRVRT